jgi:protein involved in polysaccharide export with SLBB domain
MKRPREPMTGSAPGGRPLHAQSLADRGPLAVAALALAVLSAGCGGGGDLTSDIAMVDPTEEVLAFGPADTVYIDPSYRLGPGDNLKLVFLFDHELDDEIIVRPDGAINLPILGDVIVAGLTPGQLADTIRTAYSRYYTNPQLAVNLKEFAPPQCYILGEVKYPRAVEIRPGMSVAGAVAAAGGPTEYGNLRSTVLVRRVAHNQAVARRFDFLRFAEGRGMSGELYLQDYDIIYVPKTFVGKLVSVVDQLFGRMTQLPVFYLRGWEAFNTDLVYNREIRPSEVDTGGSNSAGAQREAH